VKRLNAIFSVKENAQDLEQTTHLHLVLRLKTDEIKYSFLRTYSWRDAHLSQRTAAIFTFTSYEKMKHGNLMLWIDNLFLHPMLKIIYVLTGESNKAQALCNATSSHKLQRNLELCSPSMK
jgi:hypothetical protein